MSKSPKLVACDDWADESDVPVLDSVGGASEKNQKFEDKPPTTGPGLYEEFEADEIQVTLAQGETASDVSSFEQLGLSQELMKGLYGLNYTKPSKIQSKALSLLLKDPPSNLIAQSQSGTGKTAAFVLTMLARVDVNVNATQAICLANTRELAQQVHDVAAQMSKFSSIKTMMAVKDSIERGAKVSAHVVIGTPGTLTDILRRKQLNSKQVKVLVLDEADAMLDSQNLSEQSRQLRKLLPPNVQVLLFSATFPDTVQKFAQQFAPQANVITLKREEVKVDAIQQYYLTVNDQKSKLEKLSDIYGLLTIGQSIIFTRTRATAYSVRDAMVKAGHQVSVLTGEDEPAKRDQIMEDFRSGKSKVLIATNVLSRGIDVPQVNLVINYDMPTDADHRPDLESYMHRIGRTGRFGRSGVSINMVDGPQSRAVQDAIVNHYSLKVKLMPDDYDDMEKMLRQFKFT